ncbi:MAG TPA: hypothetical protein VIZ22_03615, partial [Candidatus Limnocylindrales bacterium]
MPTTGASGGTGGAGASITATFAVVPGQAYGGSVGGGGIGTTGGTGSGAIGTGGAGGTIVTDHRGGGGGGRTSVDLAGTTVIVAGGGGGGGAAHNATPRGVGGGGGFTGIAAGGVAVGTTGQTGVDVPAATTVGGGQGGQAAAGGTGGVNSATAARNGAAGGTIGSGTGGNGGPDPNYDSGGGGGGGYTGGGGGASTNDQSVTGGGGGGGSSWVRGTAPVPAATVPTSVSGVAGTASPTGVGNGATGSIAIDWLPCLYQLSVSKSVSSATVNAGGKVTWTVIVTNTGPDPMTRGDTVTLGDTLPAGPNGGPAPAWRVTAFNVSGGSDTNLASGSLTCSGVSVGASMPASTTCSRPYASLSGAPSGGVRGLNAGESITISYEQIIANTAACSTITNTASVVDRATQTGTTDITGVTATRTASASLTISCYDLSITKVASPKPSVDQGGVITWTVTVTNSGPGSMNGPDSTDANPLVVSDTFPATGVGAATLSSATGPAGPCSLAGSTVTCTSGLPAGAQEVLVFTQTVGGAAAPGTVVSNTASVADPKTGDTNDSSTDQTTIQNLSLALVKTANPGTFAAAGATISYQYQVRNDGGARIAGPVTVADNKATASCPALTTVGNSDAFLDPGETVTCSATYTITAGDVTAKSVTNTATASASGITSPVASQVVYLRHLSLTKSAAETSFNAVGNVLHYTLTATNDGGTTLFGVSIVDPVLGVLSCAPAQPATLAPAATLTCSGTYSVTQADIDAGHRDNTATASSTDITGASVPATAATSVNAVQTATLSLVKSATETSYNAVGDVLHYSYLVRNTGNVTLSGPITVTDDKTTVTCPPTATLAPNATVTC